LEDVAVAICDRHTGVGADGWYVVEAPSSGNDATIRLFNSDGSTAEISGNGTRCAAAFLICERNLGPDVTVLTGAGLRTLRLVSREGMRFYFEMDMGVPRVEVLRRDFVIDQRTLDATIVDVGNPQFAVFCGDDFPPDWQRLGAVIERHPMFPHRTNVSYVLRVDEHTIEARFFERGAGETMSSGTGSTGAAAAALARGLVSSPVTVLTPAGPLYMEWRDDRCFQTGPAEIVAKGEFYLR
jgi:diaminopimelate epimerase